MSKAVAACLAILALGGAVPTKIMAQDEAMVPSDDALREMHQAFAEGVTAFAAQDDAAARLAFARVLAMHAARAGEPDPLSLPSSERLETYSAWLAERGAAFDRGDWPAYEYGSLVAESYGLYVALPSDPSGRDGTRENVARAMGVIGFAMALQDRHSELADFYAPVLDGPDGALEAATAQQLFGRAQSEWSWGGERRDGAPSLVEAIVALFDRPGGRSAEAVASMRGLQAEIARSEGRYDDAEAALAEAGVEGDVERRAGLMLARGDATGALALVLGRSDRLAPAELSLENARRGLAIEGYAGSGAGGRLALYAVLAPVFRRELTIEDEELRTVLSSHAQVLFEAGRASAAEPLLAELLRYYEARFGLDSGWGSEFATRLAEALEAQSRLAEAGVLYRQLWDIARGYAQYDNNATLDSFAPFVANLLRRGEVAEADAVSADVLGKVRAAGAEPFVLTGFLLVRGDVLLAKPDLAAAERVAREAVALGDPDGEWRVPAGFVSLEGRSRDMLATALERQGRPAAAEPIRREILARTQASDMVPREGIEMREARLDLARNLAQQRKDEASDLFAREIRVLSGVYGRDSAEVLAVSDPFARFLLATGRPGAALTPARRSLAARLAAGRRTESASGAADASALAGGRRDAAVVMVRAAWAASEKQ